MERRSFVREGRQLPVPPRGKSNRDDLCVHLSLEDLQSLPGLAALDEAIESFAVSLLGEMAGLQGSATDRPHAFGPSGERLRYAGRGNLMVACYPGGGASHGVHIDNADGDGRDGRDFGRCFTVIYYLNDRWTAADGGALRCFLPCAPAATPAGHSTAVDVLPEADTVAVFRADRMMHEVRPCPRRHRYAASVWILAGPEEGVEPREYPNTGKRGC
jgi:hypothetical protein